MARLFTIRPFFLAYFVGKSAKEDAKADDPKAGADIGKIVNLMAGDAGRVSTHFVVLQLRVIELRD